MQKIFLLEFRANNCRDNLDIAIYASIYYKKDYLV